MGAFVTHNDKEIKGFFGPYRFLSNFHGAKVWYGTGGKHFLCVEAAYQYAKLYSNDWKEYDKVYNQVRLMNGKEAKKWGRELIAINPNWDKIKFRIMKQLVMDKFSRSLQLQGMLLETGDRYLEETNNWHDNIWGNCACSLCTISHNTVGEGQNNLGKILMKVRDYWK